MENTLVRDRPWIEDRISSRLKFAHFPYLRQALLRQNENSFSPMRILDVGCGPGNLAAFCGVVPGWEWYGVDLYASQLDQAADKKLYRSLCQVNVVDGLPFRSGTLDAVVCSEILMYLPNPEEIIAESYRVLAPGGQLYVHNPIAWLPRISSRFKKLFRKIYQDRSSVCLDVQANWRGAERVSRIAYYSPRSLIEQVASTNFQVTDVAGFRLFRNRIRFMAVLENYHWYRSCVGYLTSHYPYLATDMLIVGRKNEESTPTFKQETPAVRVAGNNCRQDSLPDETCRRLYTHS